MPGLVPAAAHGPARASPGVGARPERSGRGASTGFALGAEEEREAPDEASVPVVRAWS